MVWESPDTSGSVLHEEKSRWAPSQPSSHSSSSSYPPSPDPPILLLIHPSWCAQCASLPCQALPKFPICEFNKWPSFWAIMFGEGLLCSNKQLINKTIEDSSFYVKIPEEIRWEFSLFLNPLYKIQHYILELTGKLHVQIYQNLKTVFQKLKSQAVIFQQTINWVVNTWILFGIHC